MKESKTDEILAIVARLVDEPSEACYVIPSRLGGRRLSNPQVRIDGKLVTVIRLIFERQGRELPEASDGRFRVERTCEEPSCLTPSHLRPLPPPVRGPAKPARHVRIVKDPPVRFTEDDLADEVLAMHVDGATIRGIANELNLSVQFVRNVVWTQGQ